MMKKVVSYEKLIQMLSEIDKDQIDEIYVEDFMHGSTEIFISMKEKEVSYESDGRERCESMCRVVP
jgi:hypothetical protein